VPSEWYYSRESQSIGPITLEELKRLADGGELQRSDLVWTAPMSEWEEAGGFEELFPPVTGAPVPSEPVAPSTSPIPSTTPRPAPGYQGRGQGGHQSSRAGRGYSAQRSEGIPPIVLVGFIISIVGIPICAPIAVVGSILCMIGMPEAKRRQQGKGLAIAGIVIGLGAFVLSIIGLLAFFAMSAGGMGSY
jgi:hypothetical protein